MVSDPQVGVVTEQTTLDAVMQRQDSLETKVHSTSATMLQFAQQMWNSTSTPTAHNPSTFTCSSSSANFTENSLSERSDGESEWMGTA